jgi:hypothetical protein
MPVDEDGYRPHHLREGDYYTPVTTGMLELFDQIRIEHGGTWKAIVRQARISTRGFRRLREGYFTAVSYTTLEKILTRTGFEHRMHEWPWYTPKQLVEMGIWKPMRIDGLYRGPPRRGVRMGDATDD